MTKIAIEKYIVKPSGNFPNNPNFPFLHYKKRWELTAKEMVKKFVDNGWFRPWVDSIFTYNHYHSNNHEVLGIADGQAVILIGGDEGKTFQLVKGDVIVIPAGVSHKRLESTNDFKVVGAYSIDKEYNMKYGYPSELEAAAKQIKELPTPETDPVFGADGPLMKLWKTT